jgi:hypothetical protein
MITVPGIDLVGFDACYMAMVEVAYELSGVADYMVASQAGEPLSGWAYDYMLQDFVSFGSNSPEAIGRFIVDSYINHTPENNITLSLVNIKNINNLINRINTFTSNMMAYDTDDVITARVSAQTFNSGKSYSYLDLLKLVENMSNIPGAQELLNEIQNTVVYCRNKNVLDSHGLCIYFPYSATSDSEYSDYHHGMIHFARDTLWDEFLADYYSKIKFCTIETVPNKGPDSIDTDTHIILYSSDGDYMDENDNHGDFNPWFSRIDIPLVKGKTYYVHVFIAEFNNGWKGPYSIIVSDAWFGNADGDPDEDAYEPNNDWDSATFLPFGEFQDHFLTDDDSDWLKFKVP